MGLKYQRAKSRGFVAGDPLTHLRVVQVIFELRDWEVAAVDILPFERVRSWSRDSQVNRTILSAGEFSTYVSEALPIYGLRNHLIEANFSSLRQTGISLKAGDVESACSGPCGRQICRGKKRGWGANCASQSGEGWQPTYSIRGGQLDGRDSSPFPEFGDGARFLISGGKS